MRMERLSLALVEFPADEPERALRFWGALLGAPLERSSGGVLKVEAGSIRPHGAIRAWDQEGL